jgi:hypothetical protein
MPFTRLNKARDFDETLGVVPHSGGRLAMLAKHNKDKKQKYGQASCRHRRNERTKIPYVLRLQDNHSGEPLDS